jgi:hypothetical protein
MSKQPEAAEVVVYNGGLPFYEALGIAAETTLKDNGG